MMKAIVIESFGGPEVLKLAEVPKPEVRPGTVLVRTRAAGVNFADTHARKGGYSRKDLPFVPGGEGAGEIEQIGEGVRGLEVGARVAATGQATYAEYFVAPAQSVIPLPDFVSFEEGAAFPIQVMTAWHLLHSAHATNAGQTVVIHAAAGGVGLAAIQIAKVAGARVIGTVSSEAKAKLAREHGADDVIDYVTEDFGARVLELTSGRGADLVLDSVGKPTFERGLACLAPLGHIIVFGGAGGPPDPLNVMTLFDRSRSVSGFVLTHFREAGEERWRKSLDGAFELMRQGKLRVVIGKSLPLAEAAEAHRWMESRGSIGKLVLVP